jgi:hypothetical protein
MDVIPSLLRGIQATMTACDSWAMTSVIDKNSAVRGIKKSFPILTSSAGLRKKAQIRANKRKKTAIFAVTQVNCASQRNSS